MLSAKTRPNTFYFGQSSPNFETGLIGVARRKVYARVCNGTPGTPQLNASFHFITYVRVEQKTHNCEGHTVELGRLGVWDTGKAGSGTTAAKGDFGHTFSSFLKTSWAVLLCRQSFDSPLLFVFS